jgi:hypothetical protein
MMGCPAGQTHTCQGRSRDTKGNQDRHDLGGPLFDNCGCLLSMLWTGAPGDRQEVTVEVRPGEGVANRTGPE